MGGIFIKNFTIDYENRMISTDTRIIYLSQKEFDLFVLFCQNPRVEFTKEEIYQKLWTSDNQDIKTVSVHVWKLRKKLRYSENSIGIILNKYGAGYKFLPARGPKKVSVETS